MYLSIFTLWLVFFGLTMASPIEERTWTRASDNMSLQGTYIYQNIEEKTVTFTCKNKEYTLPASTFIKADIDYIAKQAQIEAPIGKSIWKKHKHPKADIKTWHSYLPPNYRKRGTPSPVCFIFCAGGNPSNIMKKMTLTADTLGWVLIGIDSYSNRRIKEKLSKKIRKDCDLIQQEAFTQFNINPNKVIFAGMSGGGWWSYRSSHEAKYPGHAVIPFGGWLSYEYDVRYPKLAVAIVNGDNDKNANAWIEKDSKILKKTRGTTIKVFHFPGGHTVGPPPTILQAAQWIETQLESE